MLRAYRRKYWLLVPLWMGRYIRRGLDRGRSVLVRITPLPPAGSLSLPVGLETLLRGLLIGFSIAAPVGPIGVLCIRRTLADGRVMGLAVGLGAAAATPFTGPSRALG